MKLEQNKVIEKLKQFFNDNKQFDQDAFMVVQDIALEYGAEAEGCHSTVLFSNKLYNPYDLIVLNFSDEVLWIQNSPTDRTKWTFKIVTEK